MAFPNLLFGPDGEQFKSYTDKRWPLGTQLVLQDGRKFRFALNGAVTGVAGDVYQSSVPAPNHVGITVQAAAAIGSRVIAATLGATAAAADLYADGIVSVTGAPGNGFAYKIRTHAAVLSSGVITVTLDDTEAVQVALSTSSTVDLFRHPYAGVVIAPITTRTTPTVGVMVSNLVASTYGWIQTRGPASVLANGTVVVGDQVVSPSGAAGAVMPASGTYAAKSYAIGQCMAVGSTSTTVYLTLDG